MKDFFEQQEQARRNTTLLVLLFVAAVIVIVLAVYAAVSVGFIFVDSQGGMQPFWDVTRFFWVVAATTMIVAGGSAWRSWQLRQGGGAAVAEMVGGERIPQASSDPLVRRLLNVVEEMAIASGLPVPPVYLLQQSGVNAFAAGYGASDAVIAVTHGAIELLDRDQLQGVIAHEFSHILNGDTRLKMRLMGLLYGITLISDSGILMMTSRRTAHYSHGRERGVHPAIALVGFLVFMVGTIGAVFADLIKRAVSRQREFLADAAAVQFTRNPQGIAGALKVIGGFKSGSRVAHPGTSEASHFFFGNARKRESGNWWSTHPPLVERISRLDPAFEGEIANIDAQQRSAAILSEAISALNGNGGMKPGATQRSVTSSIGQPDAVALEQGSELLAQLPELLRIAARDPYSARAIVYALLLDTDKPVRSRQLQILEVEADANVFREMLDLRAQVAGLAAGQRIPLLELLIPTLKSLSPDQYARFRACVAAMIKADAKMDIFEYMLQRMLLRHLRPAFAGPGPVAIHFDAAAEVAREGAVVISMLIGEGRHANPDAVFTEAISHLLVWQSEMVLHRERPDLMALDQALAKLALATPAIKRGLIQACETVVLADGSVRESEFELLRAICDALDCPMPQLKR